MDTLADHATAPHLPDDLTLVEVVADASGAAGPVVADTPGAWAYRAIADVDREIQLDVHGHDDMAADARAVLTGMQHQEYETKRRFVVVRTDALRPGEGLPGVGDVVGHLLVGLPVTSNTHLGEVLPFVRPTARSRGVGAALLALGERIAGAAHRTTLLSFSEQGQEPEPGPGALDASTGSGRVAADAPATRFALAHGYALEQVERHSVLDLPVADGRLDRFGADSRAAAGEDYRLRTWTDEVPDAWAEQVGVLFTRMSTDAPSGGVDYGEDPWDAHRVRTWVQQTLDKGRGFLMTTAEHAPSGVLAAFTLLMYHVDRPEFADQEDTLVLREHRGRRLGMLVKVVNLEAFATARPGTRRVHTGNAEENQHMLAINVALGFRPAGGWAAWQKLISGAPTTGTADETTNGSTNDSTQETS